MGKAASGAIKIREPYLLFIGDVSAPSFAKTGFGLVQWKRQSVAGQLRFHGNGLDLGVPDMTIEEAVRAGAKSLVIGVTPVGGMIGPAWMQTLADAARAGLDIVSGLHMRLDDAPGLAETAMQSGARLVDVRRPPAGLPVGTGVKRPGKRVLMVGTDCAAGKKYTALALTDALKRQGVEATFRATGQTGIMIAGEGVPIDAVVSDFLAGAAEILSPPADERHWDVIEGQGSLIHPSFAGVSLGLLHGSQPDEIILCHVAGREFIESAPHIPIPKISEVIRLNLECGALTNKNIACLGVSVNASGLRPAERDAYKRKLEDELSLPCVDPIEDGCDAFAAAIATKYGAASDA